MTSKELFSFLDTHPKYRILTSEELRSACTIQPYTKYHVSGGDALSPVCCELYNDEFKVAKSSHLFKCKVVVTYTDGYINALSSARKYSDKGFTNECAKILSELLKFV